MLLWGADSRPESVTLIDHAFQVDKEGKINRNALLSLRRFDRGNAGSERFAFLDEFRKFAE